MKFILTYRNGKQEAVITDATTCEDQAMRSFGLTLEEAKEFGANVEFADAVENAFSEDEFLQADPSGELKDAKPVGDPNPEAVAQQEATNAEPPHATDTVGHVIDDGAHAVSTGSVEQSAAVQVGTDASEVSTAETAQDAKVFPPEIK